MVLGLLVGLGIVRGACKVAGDYSQAAYPQLNKKQFDLNNMANGINPKDIYQIAARCGVRPKDGILPLFGYQQCLDYVHKYANTHRDIDQFKNEWINEVKRVEAQKAKQLIKDNDEAYTKMVQTFRKDKVGNDVLILAYNHWWNLTEEEHNERVHNIYTNTYMGERSIKKPIIRFDPKIYGKRTEVWQVKAKQGERQENQHDMRRWLNLYGLCCKKCGYESKL